MGEVPAAVRVLSVCRVAPAPAAADAVKVRLSFLDALWIATPPTQQVFLYELGGGDEFPEVVKRLKDSLAAALALYLPLAGKLSYVSETGDVVVDCSDGGDIGVTFVEAETVDGGRMDLHRLLGGGDAHNVAALLGLVPENDARVLPAPVLLLQATRLGRSGGLALGMSVHHAVADGHAVGLFMDAWASAARGGSLTTVPRTPPPHYGGDAIAYPRAGELAREVLTTLAPNLPVANAKEDYFSQRFRLARQRFHLGAGDIRWLRRRIDALPAAEADADTPEPVSTFVALCALGWTAFVRAKSLAAGDDAHLLFQADLRAHLRPPVGEGYFGNCIRPCLASADAGELLDAAGLLRAARAIRVAVREVEAAPLAGIERWPGGSSGWPS